MIDRFEVNASEQIFHCYQDGEWVDTYGFWDLGKITGDTIDGILDDNLHVKIVKESSLDLTKYEEVRIIQKNDDDTMWAFNDEKEMPDDYVFNIKVTHVLLPNGESWDMYEVDCDDLDWGSFESSSGVSFIDYYSATKDGIKELDEEELNEDDEDQGW